MTAQRHAYPVSALTIDVEDYFQVSGFEDVISRASWGNFESRVERETDRLLGILDDYQVAATFFMLGWTAERHPALVRRIQAAGHELACHSYAHRLVYQCNREEFREDTRRAKRLVEDLVGAAVIGYRAPSFSITRKSLWALEILADEGFQYDSSMFPVLRDRYGIPNIPRHTFRIDLSNGTSPAAHHVTVRPNAAVSGSASCAATSGLRTPREVIPSNSIVEIPPSTVRWLGVSLPMGGGGYLRLFPDWLFHRAIRHIVEGERKPAILYLHPWELDPDQPRIHNGSRLSQFRHTINLAKTEKKLTALLSRWRFSPLTDVVEGMDDLPLLPLAQIARQVAQ